MLQLWNQRRISLVDVHSAILNSIQSIRFVAHKKNIVLSLSTIIQHTHRIQDPMNDWIEAQRFFTTRHLGGEQNYVRQSFLAFFKFSLTLLKRSQSIAKGENLHSTTGTKGNNQLLANEIAGFHIAIIFLSNPHSPLLPALSLAPPTYQYFLSSL